MERGQKHTKQTINYYSIIGQGFNEAGGCSLVHLCQPESLKWVAESKHVLINISPHIRHPPSEWRALQTRQRLLGSHFPAVIEPYRGTAAHPKTNHLSLYLLSTFLALANV